MVLSVRGSRVVKPRRVWCRVTEVGSTHFFSLRHYQIRLQPGFGLRAGLFCPVPKRDAKRDLFCLENRWVKIRGFHMSDFPVIQGSLSLELV